MTKDDFIYALKTCEYTVHNGQVMYAEEDLIKRFDELLSITPQKSGEWIPVNKGLPEDKTYVLTTIKVPNRIAHARSSWYECGFFHNDNGDTWRATDMEVKAWMPLPKPFEPQKGSDKE